MTYLLLVMLTACKGEDAVETDLLDTDVEDTEVEDTEPPCATVTSGEDWAWNGECPQMRTPCEIEVTGCAMTIAYSSGMTMGMPNEATVDGDTVTFSGGSVPGCGGTVEDADTIRGSCADGCTFTLER